MFVCETAISLDEQIRWTNIQEYKLQNEKRTFSQRYERAASKKFIAVCDLQLDPQLEVFYESLYIYHT